jgi:hypothetical protein
MLMQLGEMGAMRALLPARALGLVSVVGMALTTFPPTSLLGAILWTGYLGDLVATHLRIL